MVGQYVPAGPTSTQVRRVVRVVRHGVDPGRRRRSIEATFAAMILPGVNLTSLPPGVTWTDFVIELRSYPTRAAGGPRSRPRTGARSRTSARTRCGRSANTADGDQLTRRSRMRASGLASRDREGRRHPARRSARRGRARHAAPDHPGDREPAPAAVRAAADHLLRLPAGELVTREVSTCRGDEPVEPRRRAPARGRHPRGTARGDRARPDEAARTSSRGPCCWSGLALIPGRQL